MCCLPKLKKSHDPRGGLNERLSDPSQGVLGRFISRDPIGHRGGLNLYSYPTNPVNFVDPEGLEEWWQASKQRPVPPVWQDDDPTYPYKLELYKEALERYKNQPHGCPNMEKGEHLDPGYALDAPGLFTEAPFFAAGAGLRLGGGTRATGAAAKTIRKYPNPNRALSGLRDLGVGEVVKIQRAVNKADSPLTVIGSAAKGTRGQLSDTDYVVRRGTEGAFKSCNLPGPAQVIPTNTPLTTWSGPSILFRPNQMPKVLR